MIIDKLFGTVYKILNAIEEDGTPTYSLMRTWWSPLASGCDVVARNPDRSVLERAIKHLEGDET